MAAHRTSCTFNTIEEYQSNIYQLDFEAIQLSRGSLINVHNFCFFKDFSIGYREFDGTVVHAGAMPHDLFYFVFPINQIIINVEGHQLSTDNICIIPPGKDNFSQFTDIKAYVLTANLCLMEKYFEPEELKKLLARVPDLISGRVLLPKLGEFRRMFFTITQQVLANKSNVYHDCYLTAESNIFNMLRELFEPLIQTRKPIQDIKYHKQVLDRAFQYLTAAPLDVSVPELAEVSFTSLRNLEYAFKKRFGITPVTFLKIRKINRIRQYLLRQQSGTLTFHLTELGVSNIGRFSSEYRHWFGESPSHTLKGAIGVR